MKHVLKSSEKAAVLLTQAYAAARKNHTDSVRSELCLDLSHIFKREFCHLCDFLIAQELFGKQIPRDFSSLF